MDVTIGQAKAIIYRVMGNSVRSSQYGFAGAKNPMPYAMVDDNDRRVTMIIEGETEEQAIQQLAQSVAKEYPLRFKSAAQAVLA